MNKSIITEELAEVSPPTTLSGIQGPAESGKTLRSEEHVQGNETHPVIHPPEADFLLGDSYPGRSIFERR